MNMNIPAVVTPPSIYKFGTAELLLIIITVNGKHLLSISFHDIYSQSHYIQRTHVSVHFMRVMRFSFWLQLSYFRVLEDK